MAPPSRLRPHLNDLLQKNHDLEHTVADLRHQLTQSSAQWADERKTLAVGCDSLMASFAKFRARLDTQPSDWGELDEERNDNTEGEREGMRNGEGEEPEGDQEAEDLHTRCNALVSELHVKEEILAESRRKLEAVEEKLHHVQETLQARIEQLQEALDSAKADGSGSRLDSSPRAPTQDMQATPEQVESFRTELASAKERVMTSDQEINRLKQLLQQWQKYGNDWKRDAQSVRERVAALEDDRVLLERERKETQRLANALAEQAVATDYQKAGRLEAIKRIAELEEKVDLLRAQMSPEQLAAFDSAQNQPAQGLPTQPTVEGDKRNETIILRIPFMSAKKPSGENSGFPENHENRTSASAPTGSLPRGDDTPPSHNTADNEVCIHTCNPLRCRNESHSFLWPRRRSQLPRHVLSKKRHRTCTPACPGHRLLGISYEEAMTEPRTALCREPTEDEMIVAAAEGGHPPADGREGEHEGEQEEGENEGVQEEGENEGVQEERERETRRQEKEETGGEVEGDNTSRRRTIDTVLGKRLRSHVDGDNGTLPPGVRKLRSRPSKS
ncbi:hypothetical protein HYDPIDRAFT_29957 [Hydnomerulius pinastri MD-312]|uniref:Uncharacterized protein n=1 Tax=Hydnomerulius pinastri MD-312 TaxID=994086 RepID=A0A0C9W6Z1_9AGAM|nr:hypothetical protein HYDPIDRAFT_29957 [Hydnomerulius pinastri MD-312]